MTDYSELKRLASAAKNWGGEVGEDRWYEVECFKRPYFGIPDAEFLAACEPGAILALIAENEHIQESHEQVCTNYNQVSYASEERGKQIDQLKAENEALRKQVSNLSPFNGFPKQTASGSNRCLACGEFHYGIDGLPCPKMTLVAQQALSMENQRVTPIEPLRVPHPLDAAMSKGERS